MSTDTVKVDTLTVKQLKDVLSRKKLSTQGNRSELILRLIENSDSDIINIDSLKEGEATADVCMEDGIGDLREEITQLSQVVATLVQQFASVSTTFSNRTDPQSTVSHENEIASGSEHQDVSSNVHQASLRSVSSVPAARECVLPVTTVVSHMTPSEMCDIIPTFDPTNDLSPSAEQFVNRVNHLKELYHWEERKVLVAAQMKMKGAAKQWCDSVLEIHNSWKNFADALIQDFGGCDNEADVHFSMVSSVRNTGEKVIDYFYRMRALGQKYNLSDAAVIRYIRNGLKHTDLQSSLATAKFSSLNELRSAIDRYVKNRPPMLSREVKPLKNNTKIEPGQPSVMNIPVRKSSPSVVCYNCFGTGHVSINCPRPQRRTRCSVCLRTTHSEMECPEKNRQSGKPIVQPLSSNIRRITDQSECNGRLTKIITVNNKGVTAFIDPGSERSLIKRSMAQTVGTIHVGLPFRLKGFAGGEICGEEFVRVHLGIDETFKEVNLLVVPDEVITEPILIGIDFICSDNQRLIVDSQRCRLEKVPQEEVHVDSDLLPENKTALYELVDEYRDCFGEQLDQLGECTTASMEITVTTQTPVVARPYRIPFAKREVVDRIINELLKYGVIRQSTSAYASPIVLVKKSSGEDRMCIDFRALNAITEKLPFPMQQWKVGTRAPWTRW